MRFGDRPIRERIKPRIIVVLLALVGVGAACAELPAINTDECGNRIVDPTEDCDTFAANGEVCRAPGTTGACHFDCTGSNVCPPTYACGKVDGICRQSTGTFDVASEQTVFADNTSITGADFDGDGRIDAMTSGAIDVRVHYFGDRMALAKTLALPIPGASYHAGPIGIDTNGDLALLRGSGGVDVLRGQSDQTFEPVIYNSFPVSSNVPEARVILVRNQLSNRTGDSLERPTGDDILTFATDPTQGSAIIDLAGRSTSTGTTDGQLQYVAFPAKTVDQVAGSIPTGSFDEGWVCDQFALGFLGDPTLALYTPCRPNGSSTGYQLNSAGIKGALTNDYRIPTVITLPANVTFGFASNGIKAGAFAFDANADGHEDLVIAATLKTNGDPRIVIAYGRGDGTFSSNPSLTPADNAAAIAVGLPPIFQVPLAIGDLNADKQMDFVYPNEIYFSEIASVDGGPSTVGYIAGPVSPTPSPPPWTEAVIADLNRDGIPDVAAANLNGAIDLFLGNGTAAMSYLSYGIDGTPSSLAVGDFDGDLTNDLAFAESDVGADGGTGSADLDILFGQAFSFPSPPTSLGAVAAVQQLAAAPLSAGYTGGVSISSSSVTIDGGVNSNALVGSLVALTASTSSSLDIDALVGNPDRLITSSFNLFIPQSSSSPLPTTPQKAQASRIVVGNFFTAAQRDMIFLGNDAPKSYELWSALSSGAATLDATQLKVGPFLSSKVDWANGLFINFTAATNLDLLVAIAPPLATSSSPATGPPELYVFDANALTAGPGIPLTGCTFTRSVGVLGARATDFDGDGIRDLAVSCPDVGGKSLLTVFWGDGSATALSGARTSTVPLPPDPVTSLTPYRVGAVATRSILMLTTNGVYVSTPGGADGRTFSLAQQNVTLPGGSDIVSADFDGDGVADLAIGDITKTQVHFIRGIPVNDSASVP